MEAADNLAHLVGCKTTSDKIRALAANGYKRADIARLLGTRYQYVRNVLEADAAKRRASSTDEGRPARAPEVGARPVDRALYRLPFDQNGRITLPETVEHLLGLHRGGVAIAEFDGERLVLISTSAAMRRAQEFVGSLPIPKGVSLAEELIADRRREAAQDASDG